MASERFFANCEGRYLGFSKQRNVGEREISTKVVGDRREEEEGRGGGITPSLPTFTEIDIKHDGSANYR